MMVSLSLTALFFIRGKLNSIWRLTVDEERKSRERLISKQTKKTRCSGVMVMYTGMFIHETLREIGEKYW